MGYITRQPIINKEEKIFAYKFLATKNVNAEYINLMTNNKKIVFINYRNNQLYNQLTRYLENKKIGIELEEGLSDNKICSTLRKNGFLVITSSLFNQYAPFVDIVKINYPQTTKSKRKELITKCKKDNIKLLASNLSDNSQFREAIKEEFDYFQGDLYSNNRYSSNDIPAYKINYLRLLQQLNKPEPNFDKMEDIIKNDLSLSYNLFRLINSAYFGLNNEVKSIKQALTLLGLNDFRKWLSIKIMRGLSEDRPDILLEKSMIRGHLAENMALHVELAEKYAALEEKKLNLFILGLFSLIDTFLNTPLPDIVQNLSLSPEVKKALLIREGNFGLILKLMIAHEQGNWNKVSQYLKKLNVKNDIYMQCYFSALKSTQKALQAFN